MAVDADVIVVGAGFAGLSAALTLQQHKRTVLVLEARGRVGGRSLSQAMPDGSFLDMGAQWICVRQPAVSELVAKYKLKTFPTPHYGDEVIECGGKLYKDWPATAAAIYEHIDSLARQIAIEAPWTHPYAAEWDKLSFAQWLAGLATTPAARSYVGREMAGGVLARSAEDTSVLSVLFCVASAGGIEALLGTEGGAQATCVVGGTQRLAQAMAQELGDALHLRQAVHGITYGSAGVRVATASREFTAKQVIVAIPPPLAAQLVYDPVLPQAYQDCLCAPQPGNVLKLHIQYPGPFWRHQGLSGIAQTSQGYIFETYDSTPPQVKKGVLTAFSYGKEAEALRTMAPAQRRSAVLHDLAILFGDAALHGEHVDTFDWSAENYTRGGFSGHLPCGKWASLGVWHDALPGLQWAGTERATRWNGYIEGAVTSGREVALVVNQRLGTSG